MGNPFFLHFLWWSKLSKKNLNRNMDILIWNLLSESILNLGKWSNWNYANWRNWPPPKVWNWFQKQISNENVHIFILSFFRSVLSSQFFSATIDFPLYFQKVIWVGGGQILWRKNSEKAKHTGICPSYCGNVSET